MRPSGRAADVLRPVSLTLGFARHAEGSCLIKMGGTEGLCNASVEARVPGFLRGQGEGWVTAEYGMLPRATHTRGDREAARGKQSGRTQEIQRLIGRALRGICNLENLGERHLIIDCDVLEADGGTRTASIVGGFLALARTLQKQKAALPQSFPSGKILKSFVAAVSVGLMEDSPLLDLCYTEDSEADVDMNVVMTDTGDFVEIQGTGEESVFSRKQLDSMLALAEKGCRELIAMQQGLLGKELP